MHSRLCNHSRANKQRSKDRRWLTANFILAPQVYAQQNDCCDHHDTDCDPHLKFTGKIDWKILQQQIDSIAIKSRKAHIPVVAFQEHFPELIREQRPVAPVAFPYQSDDVHRNYALNYATEDASCFHISSSWEFGELKLMTIEMHKDALAGWIWIYFSR